MISIYRYIKNRKPVFWILLFIFLIITLSIYITATTYNLIIIKLNYNDGISKKATLYSVIPNEVDKPLSPLFGDTFLIHRNTVAIRASTDNYTTIKEIGSNFKGNDIVVNLYKDRNAIKYSGDSLGCITYNKPSDVLLSYSCTNPRKLVQYSTVGKDKMPQNIPIATIVQPDSKAYSVRPYRDGVLGIRMPRFLGNVPTNRFLFSTDSQGRTIEAAVPDDIGQDQLDGISVVTDISSKAKSQFLIIARNIGKIYFADTINPTIMQYKEFSLPADFSKDFDALLCNLLETNVYCFYGNNGDSPDSVQESNFHNKNKPASFIKIDFNKNKPNIEKFSTRKGLSIDSLFITNSGKLYAISSNSLEKIEKLGSVAKITTIIPDVLSVTAGNGLYFVRNNSVYRYDDTTNESYKIFSSKRIKPANIINIQDNVFINGYIDSKEGQRLHTYRITDELNNSPDSRNIDLLPLGFDESGDVSDMDLFKNNLHIRLKLNINKTSPGGVNSLLYQDTQKRVITLLQDRLVDLKALDISFSY